MFLRFIYLSVINKTGNPINNQYKKKNDSNNNYSLKLVIAIQVEIH